jgi:hypothetical protein
MQVSHIIEKCSLDMMALIEHTFFMPFAITALGIARYATTTPRSFIRSFVRQLIHICRI